MPRIKQRSNIPNLSLEQRYEKALKGLEDGTYESLAKAAQANDLSKSSLGHRKNGRRPRQEAHQSEQIFTPAAEKAIAKWILKLDDYGFSPRVDILMGLVKHLAKDAKNRQVQIRDFAQGKKPPQKNIIGKNWITRFLNRHPVLAAKFASRIDRQRANASNPRIINNHFKKLGKIMRSNQFTLQAITNVNEKGFVMGLLPRTRVLTQ